MISTPAGREREKKILGVDGRGARSTCMKIGHNKRTQRPKDKDRQTDIVLAIESTYICMYRYTPHIQRMNSVIQCMSWHCDNDYVSCVLRNHTHVRTVVTVDAVRIATVVHAMVRRCVQNPLQHTHTIDHLQCTRREGGSGGLKPD